MITEKLLTDKNKLTENSHGNRKKERETANKGIDKCTK